MYVCLFIYLHAMHTYAFIHTYLPKCQKEDIPKTTTTTTTTTYLPNPVFLFKKNNNNETYKPPSAITTTTIKITTFDQ